LISIATGQMSEGLKRLKKALIASYENDRKQLIATFEQALGQVYLQIVAKTAPISLPIMAKNVGFLLKNVPSAGKKAEDHFNKAIEVAKGIGANGILGQAYLDLGILHKTKGRIDQARKCISNAIALFEKCEARIFLEQAKEALASLG